MIQENYPLKDLNSFNVESISKKYLKISSVDDLKKYFHGKYEDFIVLSGGSNLLLNDKIDRTVLHVDIKGKKIIDETDQFVKIELNAGENWHEFIEYAVENGYNGFENLALIPGNVGTAPIQNIGAYGVEQERYFDHLNYFDIEKNDLVPLKKCDCKFAYRDSIFKNELNGKAIITSVCYKLPKRSEIDINYPDLIRYFEGKNSITNKDVFQAVTQIRRKKLPYPDELPNSGSFFKNPVISKEKFNSIQDKHPQIKYFDTKNTVKVPAAWLIENTGLKGYRRGDAGVYKKHALVLVNYGKASGKEIYDLSEMIIQKVYEKFSIRLEREVNMIGFDV